MKAGVILAQQQAGRLMRSHPIAWLPALFIQAPLLLTWLLVLAGWAAPAGFRALTAVERPALWRLVLLIAAALLALGVLYEGGWLAVADRLLRDNRAGWDDFLAGMRTLSVPLGLGRLLLLALSWLLLLLAIVLVCYLACGGDRAVWTALLHGGGAGVVTRSWAERGPFWVVGVVALLAATSALRALVRSAALYYRATMVAEGHALGTAICRGAAFSLGRGWALVGRACYHGVWQIGVVFGTLALTGLAGAALGRVADPVVVEWLRLGLNGLCLAALAAGLAVVWAYLALGDLAYHRLCGGSEGDPALVTLGVRPRRKRPRPRGETPAVLRVASEPAGPEDGWAPRAVASEGPPRGRPAPPDDLPTL